MKQKAMFIGVLAASIFIAAAIKSLVVLALIIGCFIVSVIWSNKRDAAPVIISVLVLIAILFNFKLIVLTIPLFLLYATTLDKLVNWVVVMIILIVILFSPIGLIKSSLIVSAVIVIVFLFEDVFFKRKYLTKK